MAITQEQASNMDLQELSSQLAPRGNQAAADRIAAGRAALDSGMTGAQARQAARGVSPTVTATDLTDAPETPPVTPPVEPSALDMRTVNAVSNQNQEIIRSQSENAQELDRRRQEYAALADEGTLADFFAAEQQRMGIPQNLQELQDLQLQLSDMNTDSRLTQSRIAAAPGQTMAQAGREINQEDRENAIRSAGLAARASVLQGNIETASALVNQAVNLAYQDRQLRNTNLINQINDLRGVVDQETNQLLAKEQRKYEEDQRQILRAESSVDAAAQSGYATPDDIERMLSLSGDPKMQTDFARGIIARGAIQERILDQRVRNASLAASATSRRKNLIELGMMGDPQAIAELGFDPGQEIRDAAEQEAQEGVAQTKMAAAKEIERLDATLADIETLLGNDAGLKSSTGQFRNATIAGLTPFVGENLTQISGGVPGAVSLRQEKDDWLAKVGTVLTEEGFESLIGINERVRLTPITNAEVNLAFKAASDLQNAAIKKGSAEEGTQRIVGFRMSEEQVRQNLADMYLATQKAQEEIKAIEQYGYEGYLRLLELQQEEATQ